jgi:hypothetical protein
MNVWIQRHTHVAAVQVRLLDQALAGGYVHRLGRGSGRRLGLGLHAEWKGSKDSHHHGPVIVTHHAREPGPKELSAY